MQAAIEIYFAEPFYNNLAQTSTHTTLIKCNIKIKDKLYQAIIDSSTSISMILYQIIKELGLNIDTYSSSLIVLATGPSIRLLGIIKNLSIKIEGITILLDIEVIDTTSYSLLLSNN